MLKAAYITWSGHLVSIKLISVTVKWIFDQKLLRFAPFYSIYNLFHSFSFLNPPSFLPVVLAVISLLLSIPTIALWLAVVKQHMWLYFRTQNIQRFNKKCSCNLKKRVNLMNRQSCCFVFSCWKCCSESAGHRMVINEPGVVQVDMHTSICTPQEEVKWAFSIKAHSKYIHVKLAGDSK